jgi:hypothetical protein
VYAKISETGQTGPGAYPAYCTMRTGSVLGAKRPRRYVDCPPLPSIVGKERIEVYGYSLLGLHCFYRVNVTFTHTLLSVGEIYLNTHVSERVP